MTNDIEALSAGQGCYAALLTAQGRMVSDMRVSELGDRILVDLPAVTADGVRQRLADFIFSEDVEVRAAGLTSVTSALRPEGFGDSRSRADFIRLREPPAASLDANQQLSGSVRRRRSSSKAMTTVSRDSRFSSALRTSRSWRMQCARRVRTT